MSIPTIRSLSEVNEYALTKFVLAQDAVEQLTSIPTFKATTKMEKMIKKRASGALWSISLDMKLRILFGYVEDGILLFNIGGHDEVY